MAFALILTILALVLFWFMPLGVAIAGAVVAAMLVAAKLREAGFACHSHTPHSPLRYDKQCAT